MTTTPAPPQGIQGAPEARRQDQVLPTAGLKGTRKTKVKDQEGARGGWPVKLSLALVCLIWSIPTIGLLVSSLREPGAIQRSGWWTAFTNPGELTLGNYLEVLTAENGALVTALINSLALAIPATIIPILIAAFAAYAFSWMEFRGREFLFVLFVGLLVVPLQVAFIPIIQLYQTMGISGGFLAVWLAHAGFGMPLAVYLFRNYIGALPREIIESSRVDGASHFTTFWQLIIPLSVPALAAFAIFQFLWTWNDFLVALILFDTLSNGDVTTTYLAKLIGTFGEKEYLLTSGAFITIIVPLIVFFSLQRYFVRGLTAGSVKG